MPGLVRKLVIFAAVDGLVLQPLTHRGQHRAPGPATKIAYGEKSIASTVADGGEGGGSGGVGFEAFGIVGLLSVATSSYLISITKRQQVAQIQGKPVYVITEVALTPLGSRHEAELSVARTRSILSKRVSNEDGSGDSDTDGDDGDYSGAISDDLGDEDIVSGITEAGLAPPEIQRRTSSIAEDVMAKKGSYGRFAQKWFSRGGWSASQRRNLGLSVSDAEVSGLAASDGDEPKNSKDKTINDTVIAETKGEANSVTPENAKEKKIKVTEAALLPKLLRTVEILFSTSRSFFFSYDHDITRSLANRRSVSSELPLYKEVDPLFFWNRHLIEPFIDAGQSGLVLPLMQGFVGQREFTVDSDPPKPVNDFDGTSYGSLEMSDLQPLKKTQTEADPEIISEQKEKRDSAKGNTTRSMLLTLLSRRSIQRAGLRYLRRGVDELGNTANFVETEQILSDAAWTPSQKVYSWVQVRGSIPVYFSQSPYSFKPVPQLQHSVETNFQAFNRHFSKVAERYGDVQVASLVEKHGLEAIVGDKYRDLMKQLNENGGINGKEVGFEWFDFHAICRGMKFENVSYLIDTLGEKLDSFGQNVEIDGKLLSKQSGVLRTNCMDCLDRTNVAQSACGRRALEQQLKEEHIDLSAQVDQTTQWFNTLWADNGDAISKQYASTAALKGDYTRTKKRDYKGALTDMGLSISRFYTGIVNDYFSQAAIDFLLGNVNAQVFEDFEENMMSADPGVSMQKVRQQAIEVSQKLVVADDQEEFVGGWTLLTPQTSNTIKSTVFQEIVLLLTDAALYACRFDWNMEKVSSFERIDLRHIESLKYGTYITSTLSPAQSDGTRNVGFVITYKAGTQDVTRVNTRSISSLQVPETKPAATPTTTTTDTSSILGLGGLMNSSSSSSKSTRKILALKALPSRSAVADKQAAKGISELENVKAICSEIERTALAGQAVIPASGATRESKRLVETGDVISLAEAKKNTTLLDQLGHELKKMVWA
ncbi:SacI homology domain-containing protein [Xylogone sp. PMI_703]|nr:SacI homology domain-containing protein [Xylogone sp. PMI_703]